MRLFTHLSQALTRSRLESFWFAISIFDVDERFNEMEGAFHILVFAGVTCT